MCCPALIHSVACSAWVCLAAHLLLWGKACVAQLGPKCCLQRLGPLAAHPPLAQFGSVWGFSGLECFRLSLALKLRVWGLSGLECSTDLTNCLGSVLSCAHLGTAGLGLGLAGMRIAWLLCAS